MAGRPGLVAFPRPLPRCEPGSPPAVSIASLTVEADYDAPTGEAHLDALVTLSGEEIKAYTLQASVLDGTQVIWSDTVAAEDASVRISSDAP